MYRKEFHIGCIILIAELVAALGVQAQSVSSDVQQLFTQATTGSIQLDSIYSIARRIDSIAIAEKDPYAKGKAMLLSSYYFLMQFQLDTAAVLLDSCEKTYEDSYYYSSDHGRTKFYLGRVHGRRGAYRIGESYAKEAINIFHEIGERSLESDALNLRGTLHYLMDDYTNALTYYKQSYALKLELPPDEGSATTDLLINIANLYNQLGQYSQGLIFARQALTQCEIKKRVDDIPNILNLLGALSNNLKQVDSARYYYTQSKARALQLNLPGDAFVAGYNLANMFALNGQPAESNKVLQQEIRSATVIRSGMHETAQLLMSKNFNGLHQPDSAIYHARPVFKKVRAENSKDFIIRFATVLSEAFTQKRMPDSALHYYKIAYAYKDSTFNVNRQGRLSAAFAEMETVALQKEIKLLQKETELDEAQNRLLLIAIGCGGIIALGCTVLAVFSYRDRKRKQELTNYELRNEVNQRKKMLHDHALRMVYITEGLSDIEDGLQKMKSEGKNHHDDIQAALNSLRLNRSLSREWDKFESYFGNIHPGFYERLNRDYPNSTIMERRLASLVRMNMSNAEIADVFNIEIRSVNMAKYRLKKKLNLAETQDLHQFLQSLS